MVKDDLLIDYNVGIPQGSCSGPLLWLLVINELLNCNNSSLDFKLITFADDILILLCASASFHFKSLSEIPLIIINTWLKKYNLNINISKCVFIMLKCGKNISHIPRIKIGNEYIKYCSEIKYLGIIIDKNFNFILHLNSLIIKLVKLYIK